MRRFMNRYGLFPTYELGASEKQKAGSGEIP